MFALGLLRQHKAKAKKKTDILFINKVVFLKRRFSGSQALTFLFSMACSPSQTDQNYYCFLFFLLSIK